MVFHPIHNFLRDGPTRGVLTSINKAATSRATKKENAMKTTLFLAAAALSMLTMVTSVSAGEPLYSPKGKDLADSVRSSAGSSGDLLDRSIKLGTPKSREQAYSLRKGPGPGGDKVDRSIVLMSPKAHELMAPRAKEFQVAPLK